MHRWTHSDELSCPRLNDAKFVIFAGYGKPTAIIVPRAAEGDVGKVDLTQHFAHADVPYEDLVVRT